MGILDRIFGGKAKGEPETAAPQRAAPQQAMIVHFDYGRTELGPLFELQSRLEVLVDERRLGEVDGNEVAADGSDGFLYLYGPDADALFAATRQVLESVPFMKGARVKLRYGPPQDGVRENEVVLGG